MTKADITDALLLMRRLSQLQFNPAPLFVYKPQGSGKGAAMKLQMSLRPTFEKAESGTEFISKVDGGLYLELAAQEGKQGGYPTFGWRNDQTILRAKLGLADVTALLHGIDEFMQRGQVPVAVRPRQARGSDEAPKTNVVSLFHKFGDHSTAITLELDYNGREGFHVLGLSAGKDRRRSVGISGTEMVALRAYLGMALNSMLMVGDR